MNTSIVPLSADDRIDVMDIFNHYVEHSFAAYPEEKLPYAFFDTFLGMSQGLPRGTIKEARGEIIGFGLLRSYNPLPTFSSTVEITYFIKPGYTGRGWGTALLEYLIDGGLKKGIRSIIASVSSLNEGSMRFHLRHGFVECGRFREIGRKWGRAFDVVYYQRMI